MMDRAWLMGAFPEGKESSRLVGRAPGPQPAPPSSASSAEAALLPPPAAGEGAISAAAMAPGGGAGGGGTGGDVLHFVGSRRGELGTNWNQHEAQRGVHLKSLRPAFPREKEPGAPRGGDGSSGQAPGANSPPALRQNGGCAPPLRGSFPRAGHGTSARAFEDQRSAAALVARWSRSAPSTHSSLPRRGRERAQCPPCLL